MTAFLPQHVPAVTVHTRRGAIRHSFRYAVDYVLIDPEDPDPPSPALFSRNRFNLFSVHDRDHGGPMGQGQGPRWARQVLNDHGLQDRPYHLRLLTQPRFLGYVFNPVSFWLAYDGLEADQNPALIAVIAEVSTPFGDRHSYLCHEPGFAPIDPQSRLSAVKRLHVSPFQDVAGGYDFRFDLGPDRIAIQILHRNGDEGLAASLSGPRHAMANGGLLSASVRRPLGALRTILLIYWQALRLRLKGARYRSRPTPPETEVS